MTIQTIEGRSETTTIPIGTIVGWHSSTPPSGWLMCDGSALSISTYRELYNILTNTGTTFPFGANVGSTFLLPNLNGGAYMPISPSTASPPLGANSNVGVTAGASHNHTFTIGASITGNAAGNHTHVITGSWGTANANAHTATSTLTANDANATGVNVGGTGTTGTALRAHGHNAPTTATNTYNHSAHTHGTDSSSASSDTSHTHSWSTSGDSYSPTAIASVVSYMATYYIILAKPILNPII